MTDAEFAEFESNVRELIAEMQKRGAATVGELIDKINDDQ